MNLFVQNLKLSAFIMQLITLYCFVINFQLLIIGTTMYDIHITIIQYTFLYLEIMLSRIK